VSRIEFSFSTTSRCSDDISELKAHNCLAARRGRRPHRHDRRQIPSPPALCSNSALPPSTRMPVLTHIVSVLLANVCVVVVQAWQKASPPNMPKGSKEHKVRGAHYCMHACMPCVCQLTLPFVCQPMPDAYSVCASCECVCGCGDTCGRRGTRLGLA
jgi:hypothetical protein